MSCGVGLSGTHCGVNCMDRELHVRTRGVTVAAGDGVASVCPDVGGVPKTPDTRAGVFGIGEMGRGGVSTGMKGRGESDRSSRPEKSSGEDTRSMSLEPAGMTEMLGMSELISPVEERRQSVMAGARRGRLLGGCASGKGPSCVSRSSPG